MLAAARVRRAPHSNRPLAMTQQHAVRLQSQRKGGAERRGGAWRAGRPARWEGAGRGVGERDAGRRAGARFPCATTGGRLRTATPPRARRHVGLAPPSLAAGG